MKKYIYSFIILLASCSQPKTEEAAETEHSEGMVELTLDQVKRAGITYTKVEMKNMSAVIPVTGILDVPPKNLISISAMMGGFIKNTALLQGMKVKKGDVIVTIQNPDFIQIQREYLESKSRLEFVRQEYKRQEELSKENVSATKTFQQISAELNSLMASLSALEERLRLLNINPATLTQDNIRSVVTITTPIDGFVTDVNVNIGKYVSPQDVICQIVDTRDLHAELTVFEKDIAKVKKGQKVRFSLADESSNERMGTVFLVDHKISAERTVRVHAHIDEADASLIPNMYLKALIEADNITTTVLPDEAILRSGSLDLIFIKTSHGDPSIKDAEEPNEDHSKEQVFRAIEVKRGISQNGYTEVLLPQDFDVKNSEVVVKGSYDVLSKMNNSEEEGHEH
jgi:cobalt-zinc-cadmium efflux system membrane fusion protein